MELRRKYGVFNDLGSSMELLLAPEAKNRADALPWHEQGGLRRPCLLILSLSLFYQAGWFNYARFWDLLSLAQ
jgi:hypothetical protein